MASSSSSLARLISRLMRMHTIGNAGGACPTSFPASLGRSQTCRMRRVGGEHRPGPGQAGEPAQQAAARAPVLLHPVGRIHLAHPTAALPHAHRRPRCRQWLNDGTDRGGRQGARNG